MIQVSDWMLPLLWELQDEDKGVASRVEECCLLATQLGRSHKTCTLRDVYTWGCVHLEPCYLGCVWLRGYTAMAMPGAGYFLDLANDRNARSK